MSSACLRLGKIIKYNMVNNLSNNSFCHLIFISFVEEVPWITLINVGSVEI